MLVAVTGHAVERFRQRVASRTGLLESPTVGLEHLLWPSSP